MKKKVLLVILAAAMVLSAAACSPSKTQSGDTTIGNASSQTKSEATTEAAKVATIGEYVQSDSLKITLTAAKVYDKIEQSEYIVAEPKDGKQYLVLFLEADNVSKEDQYINMFYYGAYVDDKSIDAAHLFVNPEGEDTFTGDLASGKKLSGYVAYEVKKDWKKFEFTYKDGTKYAFEFNADSIKK